MEWQHSRTVSTQIAVGIAGAAQHQNGWKGAVPANV